MTEGGSVEASNRVKAVERAFEFLREIRDRGGAAAGDLAESLDVSKSTAYNHLSTLADEGYVVKEDDEYRLGLRLISFSNAVQEDHRLYEAARLEVDDLVERTGERCQVMAEENGRGIYLYQATGRRSLSTDSRIGTSVDLHSTAIGKAMLAFQPQETVEAVLDRDGLPRRTDNTITDREAFLAELEEVREREVAFDDEEGFDGMRCVAAPIRETDGRAVGSISLSGPTTRVQGERFESELPELVRGTARTIEIKYRFADQ